MGETIRLNEDEINEALGGMPTPTVEVLPVRLEKDLTNPPAGEITDNDVDELLKANGIAPVEEGHVVLEKSIEDYAQGEHNN